MIRWKNLGSWVGVVFVDVVGVRLIFSEDLYMITHSLLGSLHRLPT
ncbi:hypothetical protein [Pasteuria penetrans]|nr:hypothetical protein [Pasteuria penetrans]